MILLLFGKLAVIFALVGVGFFARKRNIMDAGIQSGLSKLVLYIAMPALILSNADVEYSAEHMRNIVFIVLFAVAYYVVAIVLCNLFARMIKLKDDRRRAMITMMVFANVGFLGYPIISIFLPENGVFYAVFFNIIFQLFLFTYGNSLMSRKPIANPLGLIKDPNIFSAILMLALFLLQIKLPAPVMETLDILGGLCTPLSMLVIGSTLAPLKIRELFTERDLYIASFVRLLLIPFLGIGALLLAGAGGQNATVIAVLLAMPSASTVAILGERYACEPELCSKGIVLQTLLSFLTIPLVGFAVTALFG